MAEPNRTDRSAVEHTTVGQCRWTWMTIVGGLVGYISGVGGNEQAACPDRKGETDQKLTRRH